MKKIYGIILTVFTACLLFTAPAMGADAAKKQVSTSIKSSRMTYNADGQTVVFSGKVHVTRPDFELWSDKLTAYMKKGRKAAADDTGASLGNMRGGELERIVASGNVRVKTQDGQTGTATTLTYNANDRTLVMDGPPQPILKNKTGYIQADRIIHHMQTGRSDLEGNVAGEFQSTDTTPVILDEPSTADEPQAKAQPE